MMGYGYGGWQVVPGNTGPLCTITWIVVIIDLILVGFWLWKQIKKP